MRNLYHSPMHAMDACHHFSMGNAKCAWRDGTNILYMMNTGRMGQSAEGRCACENRRKTESKAFPTREHGKHGQSISHPPKELTNNKHGLFYILPFSRKNHGIDR